MKTSIKKRAWSLFLALTLMVTAMCGNVVTAKAATTDYVTLVSEYGEAQAGVETAQYSFTVDKASPVALEVYAQANIGVTCKLYKAGTLYDSFKIESTDSYWAIDSTTGLYWNYDGWKSLPAGDYSISLTYDSATTYAIWVGAVAANPEISQKKATVTVGYTTKLSVENGTVKSWSSDKKSIATVDKNGKVTGKKAGKAVITATLTDGTKLKCTVTVKANKYSATKLSLSDVTPGKTGMDVYSASFDSKGNLVLKARFVNNMSYKIVELTGIKIVIKDGNGKTIGTYKQNKKTVSVPAYSTKDFTFTIKKASLKQKKADLRNALVTDIDGVSHYYY